VVAIFYCICVYIFIIWYYRRRLRASGMFSTDERRMERKLRRQIASYFLAFILCWLWLPLLQIVIAAGGSDTSKYVVVFASAAFIPLNGFLNILVYGLNRTILEDLKLQWRAYYLCCCCFFRGSKKETEDTRLFSDASDAVTSYSSFYDIREEAPSNDTETENSDISLETGISSRSTTTN